MESLPWTIIASTLLHKVWTISALGRLLHTTISYILRSDTKGHKTMSTHVFLPFFKKIKFFTDWLWLYVCVSEWRYATQLQVPEKDWRGCQILLSRSSRWLWLAWHQCWAAVTKRVESALNFGAIFPTPSDFKSPIFQFKPLGVSIQRNLLLLADILFQTSSTYWKYCHIYLPLHDTKQLSKRYLRESLVHKDLRIQHSPC